MQGNNYGLLVKMIRKFPKSPIQPARRVLTSVTEAPNLQPELLEPFELTLIELGFNMIENLLCLQGVGFISPYVWFCYVLSYLCAAF